MEKNISWAYYGDQWNTYLANPDGNYVFANNTYCNICNPFQYSTSIMTHPAGRTHLRDTTELYEAIADGTLPAVSFVKPDGWLDGHPSSHHAGPHLSQLYRSRFDSQVHRSQLAPGSGLESRP
jgi:phospholipase C